MTYTPTHTSLLKLATILAFSGLTILSCAAIAAAYNYHGIYAGTAAFGLIMFKWGMLLAMISQQSDK